MGGPQPLPYAGQPPQDPRQAQLLQQPQPQQASQRPGQPQPQPQPPAPGQAGQQQMQAAQGGGGPRPQQSQPAGGPPQPQQPPVPPLPRPDDTFMATAKVDREGGEGMFGAPDAGGGMDMSTLGAIMAMLKQKPGGLG
jgi:hypothetical protein